MTSREAKGLIGKLGKEEIHHSYSFQSADYKLQAEKMVNDFVVLVCDLNDGSTWAFYGTERVVLAPHSLKVIGEAQTVSLLGFFHALNG